MKNKIIDKIMGWLYSKMLTYELWKWMRVHKYADEIQKRKSLENIKIGGTIQIVAKVCI